MCGFAGFVAPSKYRVFKDDLSVVGSTLAHRGPDASGSFFNETAGVGLAHRRLSIIDLSTAGNQPMSDEAGILQIVFNGEIYNYRRLRCTLIDYGHKFHTHTDTEVVLKAYLQWGEACLERLIGMFAFAIWDNRKRSILLVRDRIGIKPLYYYYENDTLLFASELKALMAFKGFPRIIDEAALAQYLHYQYVPAPRTIFKDTYKLLPGTCLLWQGKGPELHQYWRLPTCSPHSDSGIDETDYLDDLDRLLTQVVAEHLVSDVPIGALLSGGIDSSLVAALMQKTSAGAVRTFSIGFKEKQFNEAPWAARVAAHLGTDHTELYIDPRQALQVISRLPEIYDEPFADSSAIPTFLVSQLTRSHVTVALSGDGGDEQFAGYVRYWMTRTVADWQGQIPAGLRRSVAGCLARMPSRWLQAIYEPIRSMLPQRFQVANFQDKWSKLILQLTHDRLSELYRTTVCLWSTKEIIDLIGGAGPPGLYESLFDKSQGWPTISRLMYVDQGTYLPDAMLTKVDRASMAASLEVRVPLLDHRVVDFTARLPEHLKYHRGSGKYLLKKLLARYVPRTLFERPKMGFGVPLHQWLNNELRELMLDYLSPKWLEREGRFNADMVSLRVKEHLNGTGNHHHKLWPLIMWEMWRERWL